MRRYSRFATIVMIAATGTWLGGGGLVHAEKAIMKTRQAQMQADPATTRESRQPQTTMQPAGGPQLPQGVTQKDLGAAGDVRETFATFAKDALKHDNFKSFASNFVDTDRDRLERAGNQNMDAWNRAVDAFDQAWKSKYNASFDISDRDRAYSDRFLAIATGQLTSPQQISHWPLPPTAGRESSMYQQATANPNIKKNTELAVVTLQGAGTGNEQPVQASLLREGRTWKIDIPDTVAADDLKASMVRHLTEITQMKDQWPGEPNDAARLVTYHLLLACYTAGPSGAEMGGGSVSGSSASQGKGSASETSARESQGTSATEHQGNPNAASGSNPTEGDTGADEE